MSGRAISVVEERLRRRVAELEIELAARDELIRQARTGLLVVGDLEIRLFERSVLRDGQPMCLLPREYALLVCLAREPGIVVRSAVLQGSIVARATDPATNVVAVHVSRLRAKLAGSRVGITTERGQGYRLVVAAGDREDVSRDVRPSTVDGSTT